MVTSIYHFLTRVGAHSHKKRLAELTVHYWNKANFEGLNELADALDADTRLSPLAEYCRLREEGLRKDAFQVLEVFVADAKIWETDAARESCQRILELHARTPESHQFLSRSLLDGFILPTLDSWLDNEPDSHTALRWLGLLRRDTSLLKKALLICPSDTTVRKRIVDYILGDVEYATDRLFENRLLGDLQSTKRSLSEAAALIEEAPDATSVSHLRSEVEQFEELLEAWEAYSSSPEGSFAEWYAGRRKHAH